MTNTVYLIDAIEDCPECKGERTTQTGYGRCTICDGKGYIRMRTSLIAALRDLKQQGKLP